MPLKIILATVIFSSTLFSCYRDNVKAEVLLFIDYTEREDAGQLLYSKHINTDEILAYSCRGWDTARKYNCKITLVPLRHVSSSKKRILKLPVIGGGYSKKYVKKELEKIASDSLPNVLLELNQLYDVLPKKNIADSSYYRRSKLLKPISKELKKLSEQSADNKVAIIYSDMLENSGDFSAFYSNVKDLQSKREDFDSLLEKRFHGIELSDIDIRIVYIPNEEYDAVQSIAIEWYEDFFEKNTVKSFEIDTELNP